jgi:hypothetical protein
MAEKTAIQRIKELDQERAALFEDASHRTAGIEMGRSVSSMAIPQGSVMNTEPPPRIRTFRVGPVEIVALKLGARYSSAGWYAPPGVDLAAFGERGWL